MKVLRSGLILPSMSNRSMGRKMRLSENMKMTIRRGFSLIKNLNEWKVPNLTV